MMKPITDFWQHVVCYADAETGQVESKYKRQTTRTILPIGGKFSIVRDGTETEIIRVSATELKVDSHLAVA